MSERTERCETCRFWQKKEYAAPAGETAEQREDRLDNQDKMSECRIRSVPHSLFPNRRASDWCGEWAATVEGGDWPPGENGFWSPLLTRKGKWTHPSVEISEFDLMSWPNEQLNEFLRSHGFDMTKPIKFHSAGGMESRKVSVTQHNPEAAADGMERVLPHPDAIPQWRKRPTLPGLYVCFPGMDGSTRLCAISLDEIDIGRGEPRDCEWCYGPIEKPKATS